MANPRMTVEAPSFVPAVGGLLAAINVVDESDPHVNNGVVFLSHPECGFAGFAPGLCEAPDALSGLIDDEKEFVGLTQGEGVPFAVYKGVSCYLDGSDDYSSAAQSALVAGESYAVEVAVETLILANGDAISASTVGTVEALALAEEWASKNYNGLPLIHMGRYAAIHLAKDSLLLPGLDGSLVTVLGTPVVVGSGYSGATAGVFDMWVTGQMTAWHGPTVISTAEDTTHNKGLAVAERVWSVSVDCDVVGKITATTIEVTDVNVTNETLNVTTEA